jgi:glutathione S-transferase
LRTPSDIGLCTLNRVKALAGKAARATCDTLRIGFEASERMLDHPSFTGVFCIGDAGSMADCVLIPQLYNIDLWQVETDDLARLPKVVIDAWPRVTGIKELHARQIRSMLQDNTQGIKDINR